MWLLLWTETWMSGSLFLHELKKQLLRTNLMRTWTIKRFSMLSDSPGSPDSSSVFCMPWRWYEGEMALGKDWVLCKDSGVLHLMWPLIRKSCFSLSIFQSFFSFLNLTVSETLPTSFFRWVRVEVILNHSADKLRINYAPANLCWNTWECPPEGQHCSPKSHQQRAGHLFLSCKSPESIIWWDYGLIQTTDRCGDQTPTFNLECRFFLSTDSKKNKHQTIWIMQKTTTNTIIIITSHINNNNNKYTQPHSHTVGWVLSTENRSSTQTFVWMASDRGGAGGGVFVVMCPRLPDVSL